MNIFKTVCSEFIKIKRTPILYICFITATVMPLYILGEYLMGKSMDPDHQDPWIAFVMEAQQMNAVILVPLFIILMSTLLPQIEYKNHTWIQVLVSAHPFSHIIFSKFLIIQISIILLLLTTLTLMALAGILANIFNPALPFLEADINYFEILKRTSIFYISTLGLSAFQFWVGMRFQNFIFPISIGVILWLMGTFFVFQLHSTLFFYSYPLLTVFSNYESSLQFVIWSSIIYCVLIYLFSFWNLKLKPPEFGK